MAHYTVLMLDPLPKALESALRSALDADRYALLPNGSDDTGDRLDAVRKADFLISSQTDVDTALLIAGEKLRLILKYQAGSGTVNLDEAQSRRIPVVEVPFLALHSVAEFAVMMMLALAKEFVKAYNDTRKQVRCPDLRPSLTTQTDYAYNWVNLANFDSVYGKTVGLVGLGTVGQAVAGLLKPFYVEVLYTKPHRLSEAEEQELGVKCVGLEELLHRSDFVSLHLKLNKATENLMGEREFAMMKPGAFLINTSRGRVVDEDALYRALSSGHLAGAALDVFWMEPLPSDSPLWQLDNVIITPHVAGIPVAAAAQAEAKVIMESIAKHSE